MSDVPITVSITVTTGARGTRAHVSGWGAPEGGEYGSLWTKDLLLSAEALPSASLVLQALVQELDILLRRG